MSSNQFSRTFTDKLATRESVPVMLGLVGPSGSGKTYSALRLATGIQRVTGGDIWVVDTEARRAKHYADLFKFRWVEFLAPFASLDYLAAIEHCVKGGAKTIVVDSMSHEHEGPGGVLEEHDVEVERLMKQWHCSSDVAQIPAWGVPKKKRRQLLNAVLQMPVNFVFCFRAKEKIKMPKKGDQNREVKSLGWMPIAGEEFVYEMTLNCLLMPASGGVPAWHPEEMGEKAIIKLPEQFKSIFSTSQPLSEDIGQKLAEWAAGVKADTITGKQEAQLIDECEAAGLKVDDLKRAAKVARLSDILAVDFERARAWITKKSAAKAQPPAARASREPGEDDDGLDGFMAPPQ
jgi:ABC-type dipeptide/oligopeptide/nickel transport system ATPase subunit